MQTSKIGDFIKNQYQYTYTGEFITSFEICYFLFYETFNGPGQNFMFQ